jgi:tetratricopeptide (TPR) repeat protein
VAGIFISYRRADTEGQTGRLFEGLRRHFGDDQVFMDVTDIHAGSDFHVELERAVGACDVLLAVIGREWLESKTADGRRRLDDPEDYVRLEIAAALRRNVPVIPVLVEGAGIPAVADLPDDLRPLAKRQAVELRHAHWDRDEAALIQDLEKVVSRRNDRRPLLIAATAVLAALAAWAAWKYIPWLPSSDDVTVVVADFDGPDPQRFGVTDKVIQKLTETTSPYNVRILALRRPITESEGSRVAEAEGRKHRAVAVIWGRYLRTASTVALSANFGLLQAPQYMPVLGRLVRSRAENSSVVDLDWAESSTRMETFELQTTLSDELAYLTLFTVGMTRYAADDWDGAIALFTEALKLTAGKAASQVGRDAMHSKRGFCYAAKGDLEQAIRDYDAAIELRSENPSYWIGRGVTRLLKGETDAAIADFDRAIQLKPDNGLAYNNRAAAYSAKKEYRRAIQDYDRAIELNRGDPYFYQHRAQAYQALGDHTRAIDDYRVALTLKVDGAIFYAEGALDPARIHYERAASYAAKGDYQSAIDDLSHAIRRKPDFWLAYHDRGLARGSQGDARRAVADFGEAIRLHPDDFSAYNNRGNAYGDLGRHDEAIADFDRAIERQPDSAAVYSNRANAFVAKGELARALEDFDRAIKIDPGFMLAYHNRCLAYTRQGDLDRALADCDEAIRLAPDDPLPYNDRGFAYFRKGDFDKAIADYDVALKLKPDYALALENRKVAMRAKTGRVNR